MHQTGHSLTQIMQTVQALLSSPIDPCPMDSVGLVPVIVANVVPEAPLAPETPLVPGIVAEVVPEVPLAPETPLVPKPLRALKAADSLIFVAYQICPDHRRAQRRFLQGWEVFCRPDLPRLLGQVLRED